MGCISKAEEVATREQDLNRQVSSILDELDMSGISGKGVHEENNIDEEPLVIIDSEMKFRKEIDFTKGVEDTQVEVYYPNIPLSIIADEQFLSSVAGVVFAKKGVQGVSWQDTKPIYDNIALKQQRPNNKELRFDIQNNYSESGQFASAQVKFESRRGGTMEVVLTCSGYALTGIWISHTIIGQ